MKSKTYLLFCFIALLLCGLATLCWHHRLASKANNTADKISKKILDADKQSIDKFISQLDIVFNRYIKNAPSVVEDAPKWRVFWNTITHDKTEACNLMAQHFKKIFDDKQAILETAIDTLKYDFQKNQNLALEQLQTDVLSQDVNIDFEQLQKSTKLIVANSIPNLNNALISSVMTSILAEELTRWGVSCGITFTATASSTTIGTASGSVVPVVGTAFGFVAGMLVGITTDYYMTKHFDKKLTQEIIRSLNNSREKVKTRQKQILLDNAIKRSKLLHEAIKESLLK